MKTNLNFEFSVDDLENFVVKILTKTAFKLLGSQDPAVAASINAIQQGFMAIAMTGARQGGHIPRAYPSGGPPPPATAGSVRPIREPDAVEHCIRIEESRAMEAGWGCCGCATFNASYRRSCRHCGHSCCMPAPVVTPSPQQPPPEPAAS